jgi:uncharacterized protein
VTDDLSAPLGQSKSRKSRLRLPGLLAPTIAGVLALMLMVFVGWVLLVSDPFGGEPMAIASAPVAASPAREAATDKEARRSAEPAPSQGTTVTIIDGMSGKRQDVTIGTGRQPADAAPAQSPEAGRPPDPPSARAAAIEPRLVEMTANGPIPKIGPDGARAADVYARAPSPSGSSGPRIAIVVSGLGIGANGTTEALTRLPAAVTLAFSPYAGDLERVVSRARGEGHEILMQVPMEPFDYPDNDPGPRTLLTSIGPEQNLDRLHWFMSRCQGYVGIANYMGARFTANEPAIAPVLSDIAKRGLIYFDDGSSPRSLAVQLSGANNGAFAKANVVLDAVPVASEIDSALARLETLARGGGVGIGVASALPVSIDRIAQWAKAAEHRGLNLVPISIVASRPKAS